MITQFEYFLMAIDQRDATDSYCSANAAFSKRDYSLSVGSKMGEAKIDGTVNLTLIV
jgi:hypothetical protein